MQTKDELRNEIDDLRKIVSELKKKNDDLKNKCKKKDDEISSRAGWFEDNRNHLRAIIGPVINDIVYEKIHSLEDKIVNGLSIDVECGYSGNFDVSLKYDGQVISEDSGSINTNPNYLEF